MGPNLGQSHLIRHSGGGSQTLFEDFGQLTFTPIETTVREAIRYYQKYGTLGEYTHLRLEKEKK